MSGTFTLKINTPKTLYGAFGVSSVVLPGIDGEIGILKNHMPMVLCFRTGIVRFQTENGSESVVCEEGFCEVENNVLTVFTNHCCRQNETEEAEALLHAAGKQAEEQTRQHRHNEIKMVRMASELANRSKSAK